MDVGLQRRGNKNAPHEAGRNPNHIADMVLHQPLSYAGIIRFRFRGLRGPPRLSAVWHPQQLQTFDDIVTGAIAPYPNLNELRSI
jgi:hypothetical protein